MYEKIKEIISDLLSQKEFLQFFQIINKNGIFKRGHVAYYYKEKLTLNDVPLEFFSKKQKYDVIILFFPSYYLGVKEIIDFYQYLSPVGTLIFVDFMKRSRMGGIKTQIVYKGEKYDVKHYLIIEELREHLKQLKYSIKKKMIVDFLWLLKISNKHRLHNPMKDDFNFNKYPFANAMREIVEREVITIAKELQLNNFKILYDGKKLGNFETIDFYEYIYLNQEILLIAPFLYNAIEFRGLIRKYLKKWAMDNRLFIPVLKHHFLNNHFNFKIITVENSELLIFESYQKIDLAFLYLEKINKKGKNFEYNLLKYNNPRNLNLQLKQLKSTNKKFNIFMISL